MSPSPLPGGPARARAGLEAALVARAYYVHDKQKSQIADELGISRFKVARLLDEARAAGLVQITVIMPTEFDTDSAARIERALGLRRAIVVRTGGDAEAAPELLGYAAAQTLSISVPPRATVGVSWGATLTQFVAAADAEGLELGEVVQLVGGTRVADPRSEVGGAELVRRLARRTGADAHQLHAPLLVGSPDVAEQLRADPALAGTIDQFSRLDAAVVGIGAWHPPRSSLYDELSRVERDALVGEGATGDVCAIVLDADGRVIGEEAIDRAIGISVAQLRAVPEVIAVAGGIDKAAAIVAVMRAGLASTLVTDDVTAAEILRLSDGPRVDRAE